MLERRFNRKRKRQMRRGGELNRTRELQMRRRGKRLRQIGKNRMKGREL